MPQPFRAAVLAMRACGDHVRLRQWLRGQLRQANRNGSGVAECGNHDMHARTALSQSWWTSFCAAMRTDWCASKARGARGDAVYGFCGAKPDAQPST